MNLLPVIVRELRVQSRQATTYWLRWMSALPLLGLGMFSWVLQPYHMQEGPRLLHLFQIGVWIAIWLLVPAMVADTLSKERREGTLHLLFLTPLRPVDVVFAKGFANVLRSGMMLSAVVPLLIIPFLLGGVDWRMAVVSLSVLLSSFLLAVSSGLAGSSGHNATHRAMALAYARMAFYGLLFHLFLGIVVENCLGTPVSLSPSLLSQFVEKIGLGFWFAYDYGGLANLLMLRAGTGSSLASFFMLIGLMLVFSSMLSLQLCLVAGRNLRRFLLDPPRSRRREKLEKTFFTPRVALGFYRKWMERKLGRNPIGWLEQRTWQARLISWSWLAVLLSIYSLVLSDPYWLVRSLDSLQSLLGSLLLFSIALTAAGSFRRERETGVLEILLVSPLKARDLVLGRLRGLWGQFLPSFVVFTGVWIYLGAWRFGLNGPARFVEQGNLLDFYGTVLEFVVIYLALPVMGLYWSLRTRWYLSALVLSIVTFLIIDVGSWAAVEALLYLVERSSLRMWEEWVVKLHRWLPLLAWGLPAWFCGRRMITHLERRRFVIRTG